MAVRYSREVMQDRILTYVGSEKDLEKGGDEIVDPLDVSRCRVPDGPDV
jgi:hypothetical protein